MQIDVLSDPSCFESLQEEWHELMGRAVSAPLFVTPEFTNSWWQAFGKGTLQLITVRDDQKLLGLAPLYECDGVVSFLGSREVSDYLDVLVDQNLAGQVLEELWSFLTTQKNWRQLAFISLPQNSPFLSFIEKNRTAKFEKKQQDVCPVIQLPSSWDEYLSMIGKKQRHEIKRKWKNLEAQVQPEFLVIKDADELQKYLPEFIRLHQLSSQEKAAFWTEDQTSYFHHFSQKAAEQSWLRLFFIKIGDHFAASMLGFVYRGQFLLYNSGFDPVQFAGLSVGVVLTAFTIQQAIEDRLSVYDFLRGDEEYKFRFRAVAEPVWDVTVELR